VDQLARLLGHRMTVRSNPGKGTMFAIEVPLAERSDPVPPVAQPGPHDLTGQAAVLVIEDDEGQRLSMRLLLMVHGYHVEVVRSGSEAIALVSGAAGFRPDIIVADYNLGSGQLGSRHTGSRQTGLEAIRLISGVTGRSIPALIVTGDVTAEAARAIAAAGVHWLHKPVRPDALLETIHTLITRGVTGPRGTLPAMTRAIESHDAPASIAIIDDDPEVRGAIRDILASRGYTAIGHTSAEALLADPERESYKCLIIDIDLPGLDGLALQRRLTGEGSTAAIIFISGRSGLPLAVTAMRAGAADFLEKPVHPDTLLAIIARVQASDRAGDYDTIARRDIEARFAQLTVRQHEVLDRMIDGQPNKIIAADLGLSQRTVEHHRGAVMKTMGARSLADLVRMAMLRRP